MATLQEQIDELKGMIPKQEFNLFGKIMGGLTTAGAGYVAVDSLIKSNKARKEAKRQQGYVDTLMNQYMAKPIYNPYQNLSVATKANEIKQQETDQALANTLDTIRELGYGAGGATALARAAQKSKLGIAADIEKQEVANEQLKGKGEMIQQAEFARLGQQMDYEQSKADQSRAEQFGYAERGMDALAGLGSIGLAMGRGLAKPKSQPQAQESISDFVKNLTPQQLDDLNKIKQPGFQMQKTTTTKPKITTSPSQITPTGPTVGNSAMTTAGTVSTGVPIDLDPVMAQTAGNVLISSQNPYGVGDITYEDIYGLNTPIFNISNK
jgi:hypothetical protein